MSDEHAKLGAPIANMVEAEDVVAEKLKEAGKAVADDGGAEVAYVELFGDVWGGELDDHPLVARGGDGSKARIVELGLQRCGEKVGVECEVDEAGAGDGHLGADLPGLGIALVDDRLCDGAGVLAKLFRQLEGAIALIVAKFFLNAGSDLGLFCKQRVGARDRFAHLLL